jgi:hypothetical protein
VLEVQSNELPLTVVLPFLDDVKLADQSEQKYVLTVTDEVVEFTMLSVHTNSSQ